MPHNMVNEAMGIEMGKFCGKIGMIREFELLFWLSGACVVYPYVIYPLALVVLARWRGRPVERSATGVRPTVSVVLAAFNEEATIVRRVREFLAVFAQSGVTGEVIVVSDGSTDSTAERARGIDPATVRVVELEANAGKAAALSAGCAAARHDILVLADARQRWADDAVQRLLENFADPTVGAVGDAPWSSKSAPGTLAGVGLYWRFESALRRREGCVHSTVGVSGSIAAVRRTLFRAIPPGTILDDVYWPLCVAMQGYRVVYDERARAFDRLPECIHEEFRRKVRTLSGNYQLVARLPSALSPARNPIWLPFLSHKLMRLVVPWALLVLFACSTVLPGPAYRAALLAQAACYALGLVGLLGGVARTSRVASAAASFLVLNTAAWLAFWVWISGRSSGTWCKTAYRWTSLEGATP